MTSHDPHEPFSIDQLCAQYEQGLQADEQPHMAEFLNRAPERHRGDLLGQLLRVEFRHCCQRGARLDLDEYVRQFPEYEEIIAATSDSLRGSQLEDTIVWSQSSSTSFGMRVENQLGQTFGRFDLMDQLGQGSFGTVYRASDPRLERDVALKFAHAGLLISEDDVQRFFREARAAAQLRHQHIVPVHEAGEVDGIYYIASEYITGITLRERLAHGNPLSFEEAARLVSKLASALQVAHDKGIVHRDIKPENILIDEEGEPYIMDFGLARDIKDEDLRTKAGAVMGTPAYMSPEQAKGEGYRATSQSDLWSLGVIFYELLSGSRPYSGAPSSVIGQILEQDLPPVRSRRRDVPRDLQTICERCLVRELEHRLPTCRELAAELERWLDGRPIHSRKTPWHERARLWIRRNPLAASLSGLLVLAAVVLVVITQSLKREQQQARATQSQFDTAMVLGEAGKWRLMLDKLDMVLAEGQFDPVLVHLGRARAMQGLGMVVERNKLIDELMERDELGDHEGQVLVIYAERLLVQSKEREAVDLLREAQALGLPTATDEYVKGMLSTDSDEAIAHLMAALQHDPYHHSSLVLLCVDLFARGERDKARERAMTALTIFPNDINFDFVLSLIDTAEGERQQANARLASYRDQVDRNTWSLMNATLSVINGIRASVVRNNLRQTRDSIFQMLRLLGRRAVKADSLLQIRLAPRHRKLLSLAVSAGFGKVFSFNHKQQIRAFEQMTKTNPEGFLMLSKAVFLSLDKRWAEAAKAAERAAEMPSIFPETEQFAYSLAAGSASTVAALQRKKQDPEKYAKAVEYARKRMALGELTPLEAQRLAAVAWNGEEYDLARQLIVQALKKRPNEVVYLQLAARIELDDKGYARCLEYVKRLLQVAPEHAGAAKLRDSALKGLRETLQDQKKKSAAGRSKSGA